MSTAGQDHLYKKVELAGNSRITDGIIAPAIISPLHRDLYSKTLASTITAGDYQIVLTDATSVAAGQACIISQNGFWQFTRVLSVSVNTLTLDRRIDQTYPLTAEIDINTSDLASLAGTLASPQVYTAHPPEGHKWEITRMLITSSFSSAADLGKFAGIAALTNGLVIRAYVNGVYWTLTNWKTNGDIKLDFFDLDFDARSGGGGAHGMTGRGTFAKLGVHLLLDGDTSDHIEVAVQDDITALDDFRVNVQGHLPL